MRTWVENFIQERQPQRQLREIRQEVDKNLETFQVMQQLQELRPLRQAAGAEICLNAGNQFPPEVKEYFQKICEYNAAFQAMKDFQNWYLEDISRQTQANARQLHDLQDSAQQILLGFDRVIQSTQATLDSEGTHF